MVEMAKHYREELANAYREHRDELKRGASRLMHSKADAEDALQEAMLSVLRAPHTMAFVEKLGSWLYTLVKRRCIDIIRRNKRQRDLVIEENFEHLLPIANPEDLIEDEDFMHHLSIALRQLSEDERFIFIHHGLEGESYQELSKMYSIPMGTLMARKKRAIEKIQRYLIENEIIEEIYGRR